MVVGGGVTSRAKQRGAREQYPEFEWGTDRGVLRGSHDGIELLIAYAPRLREPFLAHVSPEIPAAPVRRFATFGDLLDGLQPMISAAAEIVRAELDHRKYPNRRADE